MHTGANSSKPHLSACKLLVNKTEKDFSLPGGTKFLQTINMCLHYYEAALFVCVGTVWKMKEFFLGHLKTRRKDCSK